jgi:excisionase family DNA binding protein
MEPYVFWWDITGVRMTDPMSIQKMLLRPREVAQTLGLSRSFTYQLIASGEIPSLRLGRAVRVPAEALRSWIEKEVARQQTSSI